MKLKYLSILSLMAIHFSLFAVDLTNSSFVNTEITPATQQDSLVLPPIRRIGINIVNTNIDEFRNFMRKQDRLLRGVVALPYNEQDLRKMLALNLEKQTKNTGRFWALSLTQFVGNLPIWNQKKLPKDMANKVTNVKYKLDIDYNLDAWITPTVSFSPDQTLVRLALHGIGQSKSNWAREDILLEAQASEDKINDAFSEALARLIATIGHDGRVTYTRENLMTVDFGSERGLSRGQKLIAGFVTLTSFNPINGEFLRAQHIPLYELKVLETAKGSSLCQITNIDKIKLNDITKKSNSSTLVLLAWKPEKIGKKEGWKEPYDPQTAPLLGATESGFGISEDKNEPPELPDNMGNPPQTKKRVASTNPSSKSSEQVEKTEVNSESIEPSQKRIAKKKAHWIMPRTWTFEELKAGGGVSLASFAQGEASAFPTILINRVQSSAFIFIDSNYNLYLNPVFQFAFYNGGNLTGNSFYLGSTLFNAAWSDSKHTQNLYLGGALQVTGGSISGRQTAANLSNLELNPTIRWDSQISGFGKYNVQGSFSLIDIAQNYSVWNLRGEIQPLDLMPKQISFDVGMKRYVNNWIEFTMGVNWDFAQND